MGRGEELDKEPELSSQALHDLDMFADEPINESEHEHEEADVRTDVSDEKDAEESDMGPLGQPEQTMPGNTRKPRRQPDSSLRHQCTEVDVESGQPCGADFSRAGHLRRHRETVHHPSNSYPCSVCKKKSFNRLDILQRHYRQCHSGVPSQPC